MTGRQAATIAVILIVALAVVGLILLRPMAPENYAEGRFSFDAVTQINVAAGTFEYGSTATALAIESGSEEFDKLVDSFDGRGFGRTPASLFSNKEPINRVGDIYWTVTFYCGLTGGTLTVRYIGGDLRISGDGSTAVTTQDKLTWANSVHDYILSLYPDPEEPDVG